jgi:lipid-A-disaccharide synthase
MLQRNPDIRFISACPNELREQQLRAYLQELGGLDINIFQGQATTIMSASDAILLASGTASLQAMLVKRPTVIAYKMSSLVFAIAKRIVKIPYIGLPNLLANKNVMPEFIQAEVIPEKMGQQLLAFLDSPTDNEKQNAFYEKMHLELKKNAGETAATAIGQLIKGQ